jgi:hypothetical protein
MKSKNALCGLCIAVVLHFGVLAGSAQTNIYLYTGSETNITLNPGTYIITAYGAAGGFGYDGGFGGLGAEMSAAFKFSASTTLTLLVAGGGGDNVDNYSGCGGGGGSFVVEGSTPLVIAGGGGGAGDFFDGGNGNVSTDGGNGDGAAGGPGGTGGGGGYSGGSEYWGEDSGGGGGGFLGDGIGGGSGFSFENGGNGGGFGAGGEGGFGGGGDGDGSYPCGGGGGGYSGGGGGGEYVAYDDEGGGGGASIIGSSAITNLTEISGVYSPDDGYYGEIIITAVPPPLGIITTDAAFGFNNGVFGFDVTGPSGSNVVIQASADLHTWIPLQTNLLGSGPLHFSDSQSPTNRQRFYRVQLAP